jgi:hypothetical protein
MEKSQVAAESGKSNDYFQKIEENSKIAEKLFKEFLNKKEIPFFFIDQNQNTKCDVFKKKGIKRPDYIIQTKNDYFYIDVKQRSRTDHDKGNEKRFTLDQNNIFSLFYFQEEFHQKVWLAYIDDLKKTDFYYISVSKVYEYFINIFNTITGDNYFDYYKDLYREFFSEESKKKLLIYIPEALFFDQLSFEKGFYKNSDKDFYIKEVDFHKSIWDNSIQKNVYKEYLETVKDYYKL